MDECTNSLCKEGSKESNTLNADSDGGYLAEFEVGKMDCPSEERLIRMSLDQINPKVAFEFDIPRRRVCIFHKDKDNLEEIIALLKSLKLGSKFVKSEKLKNKEFNNLTESIHLSNEKESSTLKWLLAINGVMFVFELAFGYFSQSTGLIADSLDMFADAGVYGLSLYAVGKNPKMKIRAAHFSGWLQVFLALGALSEVGRRFIMGSQPVSEVMIGMGLLALAANISCLLLLAGKRNNGAHMKASWIFSANDVIANSGVILAGFLVSWSGSNYPDLIIGLIIAVIVLNGARRILKLRS